MPLTDEPNASLPSPHFNEEATVLSARPVVPLASSGNYAATNAPLAKRFLPLALIVAAAVGLGIAGGLALSRRHSNPMEAKSAAVVGDEPASAATEASNPPVQSTATSARKKTLKPETQTITTSGQSNDSPPVRAAATPAATASTTTHDKHKQANVEPASPPQQISLPPAAARNKRAQEVPAPDESDARNRDDEARAERRAARAEHRRAQAAQPDAATPPLPRAVDRATQQLNRIKDIFEGPKP